MKLTDCNICGSDRVRFTTNDVVYGKLYGNGYCYLCYDCWSYVGVHTKSKEPLGILSTKEMRIMKMKCHKLFDEPWKKLKKNRRGRRQELYFKLAEKMDIPVSECHFGHFDMDRLNQAYEILQDEEWYK